MMYKIIIFFLSIVLLCRCGTDGNTENVKQINLNPITLAQPNILDSLFKKSIGLGTLEYIDRDTMFYKGNFLNKNIQNVVLLIRDSNIKYLFKLSLFEYQKSTNYWKNIYIRDSLEVEFGFLKFIDVNFDNQKDIVIDKISKNTISLTSYNLIIMNKNHKQIYLQEEIDDDGFGNVRVDATKKYLIIDKPIECTVDRQKCQYFYKWKHKTLIFVKKDCPC